MHHLTSCITWPHVFNLPSWFGVAYTLFRISQESAWYIGVCSCVAEASCDSESPGASVSTVPQLPGPSDGSVELSEPQNGSGVEKLSETAGTPQERRVYFHYAWITPSAFCTFIFSCICRLSCSKLFTCFFFFFACLFLPELQAGFMPDCCVLQSSYTLQQQSICIP